MFENSVIDACGAIPPESPQDATESPGGPGVSEDASEGKPVPCEAEVCVTGTLRLWAPNGESMGECRIETYVNGRGGHYFVCPTRMLLAHGCRVDITVDN